MSNTQFEIRNEANYAAQVVRVTKLSTLENLDNLVGLHWAGLQALVPVSTQEGDLLVVFPAESQLSEDFVRQNNLSSVSANNNDPTAKGYLGKNRRVKAIRLRGEVSNALAVSLGAFAHLGVSADDFTEDTSFDTINGVEISRKFLLPVKGGQGGSAKVQEKIWRRVDDKFLPAHIDTEMYFRNDFKFKDDDYITVTIKEHGTSVRIARTIVKRKLNWFERVLKQLGVPISETYTDVIGGSKRVIKDPSNQNQAHFYESDVWTIAAQEYGDRIPEHVVVYGELIGWVPGTDTPIQKGYTYNVPRGEMRLRVYRVAVITPDGQLYDLSWNGVKQFCRDHGLEHVVEVWSGYKRDFVPEEWMDQVFFGRFEGALPLSDPNSVDEGVVIRRDGLVPYVCKLKGNLFYSYETKVLDDAEKSGEDVIDG